MESAHYQANALRDDQHEIYEHAARFKVVACGRRWGKTMLGLTLALEAARAGQRVWWVAPTYGLAFQPWRALRSALVEEWEAKLESERHIDLPGGGSITVKSADDPDSLRGVGLDLVVLDEAAFMAEEAWTAALRPALADRQGRAVLISTPRGHNWFWHAFQRGNDPLNEDWQSWTYPTRDNPRVDATDIIEAKDSLPERIFQQEYEAAFLTGSGSVFRNIVAAAVAPPEPVPQPTHRYLMGVDFGRHHDFTCLVVIDADTAEMVAIDRFGEVNWEMQRGRIAALAQHWRVAAILAEANSMGEPNIEMLHRQGLPIAGFTTTVHSKGPLIEELGLAIESGLIKLLPDPTLLGELEAYTYSVMPYTGRSRYEAPPGLHDDTVIALALAWQLASTPRLVFGIAEV